MQVVSIQVVSLKNSIFGLLHIYQDIFTFVKEAFTDKQCRKNQYKANECKNLNATIELFIQ